MTVKLTGETSIVIDRKDVAAILSENICSYSALADLQVTDVEQNAATGDFTLTLNPKPKPAEPSNG